MRDEMPVRKDNVIFVTPDDYERIKKYPNSIIIVAKDNPPVELQVITWWR